MIAEQEGPWATSGFAVFDDVEALEEYEQRPVADTDPLGWWVSETELDEGDRVAAICELELKDWREEL